MIKNQEKAKVPPALLKEDEPILYDEEMEKIPYYMRERVAFLIN